MNTHISRRRFIWISGAAVCLGATPLTAATRLAAAPSMLHRWRGIALGADATLEIHHPDAAEGARLIEMSLAEVSRLERIFSLYTEQSALCRLNRDGYLEEPPQELVELLARCGQVSRATGGAFDATVQPLWELYAAHFSAADADPDGPSKAAIRQALARIGHEGVQVNTGMIRLARPGMKVTLNGIAQGYVTDRVAALLRANGIGHTLIDMGETRVLDDHPAGRPWAVGLRDPRSENGVLREIALTDAAMATSGAYGTQFDAAGRFNHLFVPATGGCAHRYLSVSVIAPEAATADALSTALSLMPLEQAKGLLQQFAAREAWFIMPDGRIVKETA